MKKILVISLLCLLPGLMKAQEIYNLVLESADKIINDPNSGFVMTRVAQFKKTSLVYLKNKALETKEEVTAGFLDTQAYYLSEFIALYINEILKTKKQGTDKQREKILLFMKASQQNPLFNDQDKATVESYVETGEELTPFSLDTDWEKAYKAAKEKL